MKGYCENCETYEPWNGVCVNADSEYCADFVTSDNSCYHFIPNEGRLWNDDYEGASEVLQGKENRNGNNS